MEEEEEEWIESPDGWETKSDGDENDDNNDKDDEEEEPMMGGIDFFATNSDPKETFPFEVRLPSSQQQPQDITTTKHDGEDEPEAASSTTTTKTRTISISGFRLDSGESARSTGVTLWGAAPRLSTYMMNHLTKQIQGAKVAELGAGLGLPGIVAYHLGAKQVVLTDLDTHAMQKMRENVQMNCSNNEDEDKTIVCQQLKWGNVSTDHPFLQKHGLFDLVLAADVIYVPESIDPLFDTATMLLVEGGKFLLCWITRWNNVPEDLVLGAAEARNLEFSQPEKGIYVFEKKQQED